MRITNLQKQRDMFSLLARWQESGVSQRVFADAEGISFSKFKYWHRRWQSSTTGSFTELEAPTPPVHGSAEGLSIKFPNGVQVDGVRDLEVISSLIRLF